MVFAIDRHKRPLMPVTEKRARQLLEKGRAAVHCRIPFVIRIKDADASQCAMEPVVLKIDPGSKHTGIALVRRDGGNVDHVLFLMQIDHRGLEIKDSLKKRSAVRRSRRSRKIKRFRPARYLNRKGYEDSLPPSLMHRVHTTMTWVRRLTSWCPVTSIEFEYVNFDTHLLRNPEVRREGRYQYGPLYEKELFGFLMDAFCGRCVYCGSDKGPFEKDHAVSRAHGGGDGIGNRVLSCHACNQDKGAMDYDEYLKGRKDGAERTERIRKYLKDPLHDAAAVNVTRGFILRAMGRTDLPVSCFSGGRTAFNRNRFGVPKDHALDAACVGDITGIEGWEGMKVLVATAKGHGSRQRQHMDAYGFPKDEPFTRKKMNYGFMTGDYVKAVVPRGKYKGTWYGRLSIRRKKCFLLSGKEFKPFDVNPEYCRAVKRSDGYVYGWK